MPSKVQLMLVIIGLIVLVQSGSALRCWECTSNVNPMCRDLSNATDHQQIFHTKNCEVGPYETTKPVCRKIVKRENGEKVIIRQCWIPNVDEADIVDGPCNSMPGGNVESCHICSTNLCNSATSASTMQLLYVGTLTLLGYRFIRSK